MNQDFPQLKRLIHGKQLVYLDSAATSLTPQQVARLMHDNNILHRANVHRSVHTLSEEATNEYESAREKIAQFIGAKSKEIIFTKNTTESLNLLAYTLLADLEAGDEIVLSVMEHHSNLVPWQTLAKQKGIVVHYIDITKDGLLDMAHARKLIGEKTQLVAITHVSNVLGCINPIKQLADLTHEQGALLIVDGAQSISHMPINVTELDCDFFAFSGHKMYGPTGIGVLYGREELLENMTPFLFGGEMIDEVTLEKTTWTELPWKFEAGTPPITQAIGLGEAVNYLSEQFNTGLVKKEQEIMSYSFSQLQKIPGLLIQGPLDSINHISVISFTLEGIHPHDITTLLDREGIEIRGGHHCAQPLLSKLQIVGGTARASFGVYSTKEDVDALVKGLKKVKELFMDKAISKDPIKPTMNTKVNVNKELDSIFDEANHDV